MKILENGFATAMLLLLTLFACNQVAASPTYEYHADARMQHVSMGIVEDAYGYVHLITDKQGHAVIRVMFSNGSRLDRAQFNAKVKFLDVDGAVLREEWFERRLEAADELGAAEREVTKLLDLNEFASMQVEFFLSDLPHTAVAALHRPTQNSRN